MTDEEKIIAYLRLNPESSAFNVGRHLWPDMPPSLLEIEVRVLLNRLYRQKKVRRENRWKIAPNRRVRLVRWSAR